jgi:hypothetical protein
MEYVPLIDCFDNQLKDRPRKIGSGKAFAYKRFVALAKDELRNLKEVSEALA